jgi:hypothetical protein
VLDQYAWNNSTFPLSDGLKQLLSSRGLFNAPTVEFKSHHIIQIKKKLIHAVYAVQRHEILQKVPLKNILKIKSSTG